jgi:hypothetical protein
MIPPFLLFVPANSMITGCGSAPVIEKISRSAAIGWIALVMPFFIMPMQPYQSS